jgi:endonuclease YncB( thermonuclease family)
VAVLISLISALVLWVNRRSRPIKTVGYQTSKLLSIFKRTVCSAECTVVKRRGASLRIASLFLLSSLSILSNEVAAECRNDQPRSIRNSVGVLKSVYDGDTLSLTDGKKVRLIGINTPEMARNQLPAEPMAKQATLFLRSLLEVGKPVQLRIGHQGKDRSGRTLAHVFTESGVNVTAEMLRKGYGFQVLIAPNDWSATCYSHAESEARVSARGVWAHPYHAVRSADSSHLKAGFTIVSGEVEGVFLAKKAVWVDIKGSIALKIPRDEWKRFESVRKKLTPGRDLEARGWLIDRGKNGKILKKHIKRWMMVVNHPGSLTL